MDKASSKGNSEEAGIETKVSLTPGSFLPHCGICGQALAAETRPTGPG